MGELKKPRGVFKGKDHPMWNGGKTKTLTGKIKILNHDHPRSDKYGYVFEHLLVAEKALGKPLPPKAQVHHHTFDQLVICQDQSYHSLLHRRQRAFEMCGHANWRKCAYCGQHDDPENMFTKKGDKQVYHKDCKRKYDNERYNKRIAR